jgi:hypothetical protein
MGLGAALTALGGDALIMVRSGRFLFWGPVVLRYSAYSVSRNESRSCIAVEWRESSAGAGAMDGSKSPYRSARIDFLLTSGDEIVLG